MKFFIVFLVFTIGLFAQEKSDLNDLFKKLDSAIESNKNNEVIADDANRFKSESMIEREKYYKEFNDAAKKFHLFRAKKIGENLNELIHEYKDKQEEKVTVQRYSYIGNMKFAYVSAKELDFAVSKLEANGKIYENLLNYKKLLFKIEEYDIKTIAKILFIVEQEMMNIRNVGLKDEEKIEGEQNLADLPIQVKLNQKFKTIKVYDINKNEVKLKVMI